MADAIAAHGWDVSGALAAGARAAFVARSHAIPIPLGSQPDITGDDLHQVVDQLLEATVGGQSAARESAQ